MFKPKQIEAVVTGMNCVVNTIIQGTTLNSVLRQHIPGCLVLMNEEIDEAIFSLKDKIGMDHDKNRAQAIENAFHIYSWINKHRTFENGITSSDLSPIFAGGIASHQLIISYASRDRHNPICDEAIAIAVAILSDDFGLSLKLPTIKKRYLNSRLGQHNPFLREILDIIFFPLKTTDVR